MCLIIFILLQISICDQNVDVAKISTLYFAKIYFCILTKTIFTMTNFFLPKLIFVFLQKKFFCLAKLILCKNFDY